jgi:long-subunit fatty acid transport protein
MSWGEAVTYHEIDQNRIFVGFGYQFTKDFTIQTGYFWQLLVKANGAQQENNMGIGTWLTYNFDLTRK